MIKRYSVFLITTLVLSSVSAIAAAADAPGMQGMHEHMLQMQERMNAIRAETDPAKRAELMAQQHGAMRDGMRMLHGHDARMSMDKRMEMMEVRMEMMGMMMEHMMDHANEDEATDSAAPDNTEPDVHNH